MSGLIKKSKEYAENIYQQEIHRVIAKGSYFDGYLDGMKDAAEATRCPECGFLCFFPTDGWRYCPNPRCRVDRASETGGIEYHKPIPLKTFTYKEVRGWEVPTDPDRYIHYGWKGTALDILERDDMPEEERLAYVLRSELFESEDLKKLEKLVSGRNEIEAVRLLVEALEMYR